MLNVRVLHFFKTYRPDTVGGIENVIYQICRSGGKYGVTSSVLTLTAPGREGLIDVDGHCVYRVKQNFQFASTGFSVAAIGELSRLANEHDVVHYHFPWPFMDAVHFFTRIRNRTVVTYHSDVVRQQSLLKFYVPLMNRFLGSVDRIVATSPNYAETSPVLQRFKEKLDVVPIGIDRSAYPEPSAASLERMRALGGSRFFLFVGLLRYYKGLHILLEALRGVDYRVVIAGSGPLGAELRQQAAHFGLKNVVFAGSVSEEEKTALLRLCHGFVFPSHLRSEAFGISLLEAAMMGRPMISCEIGTGTSYVNVAGETGLVVPPNDPAAFRGAMKLLWENVGLAQRMGERAEVRYQALFTGDKMTESYAAIYRRLTSAGPRSGR